MDVDLLALTVFCVLRRFPNSKNAAIVSTAPDGLNGMGKLCNSLPSFQVEQFEFNVKVVSLGRGCFTGQVFAIGAELVRIADMLIVCTKNDAGSVVVSDKPGDKTKNN